VGAFAGHPNDSYFVNMRHTPLALATGAYDDAYQRNQVRHTAMFPTTRKIETPRGRGLSCDYVAGQVLQETVGELERLAREAGEGGYRHLSLQPATGHWMNHAEESLLPWMAAFTRNPWPTTISWRPPGRAAEEAMRFYWLEQRGVRDKLIQASCTVGGEGGRALSIEVEVEGGLEPAELRVHLHPSLALGAKEYVLTLNGREVGRGVATVEEEEETVVVVQGLEEPPATGGAPAEGAQA
jgi:hypothetical protein